MMQRKFILLTLIAIAGAGAIHAGDPVAGMPPPPPPPMPQPSAQHESLKKWTGTWDATAKTYFPGQPAAVESKGLWSCKMMGGFWNLCDLQSEMMGKPFLGHEFQGYDTHRKKFISMWIDTSADSQMQMEGTASADGKTVTMWGKGYNMAGVMSSFKTVGSWFDDDHYSWKMWELPKGKGAKPVLIMDITYVRRK